MRSTTKAWSEEKPYASWFVEMCCLYSIQARTGSLSREKNREKKGGYGGNEKCRLVTD